MAEIIRAQLNAAKFFVGADLDRLQGAGDDYFEISQSSDVGAGTGGVQGDVMLTVRQQNLYDATVNCMPGSSAVKKLLTLKSLGAEFPVKVVFNDFEFVGVAIIKNVGTWAASLSSTARTFALLLAYQSGNIDTGVGEIISA